MSGGVDSTATALLLKDQYAVQGYFMQLAQPDFELQRARVEAIAGRIGIDLQVINLQQQFSQAVLDYFANSYFAGLTPNPCMVCNREIKFGLFRQAILNDGMDAMATGHYARILHDAAGYHLHDGLDPTKDQSYFLSRLTQKQLSHLIFPLGEKKKTDMYTFVEEHGFTDFEGVESQDVCFLEDESVGDYLEKRFPDRVKSGPVVSTQGVPVGKHTGLFRYTIGQRRGLGIPDSSPWYVAGIDTEHNTLVVGKSEDISHDTIEVIDLHWLAGSPPDLNRPYMVRIRYSHRGSAASITLQSENRATLTFTEKQRAITPGQFAVIYQGTEVIGSGVIIA